MPSRRPLLCPSRSRQRLTPRHCVHRRQFHVNEDSNTIAPRRGGSPILSVRFNRLPPGASSHPRIRALGAYDAYFRVSGIDQLAAEFRERGAVIREGPTNRVYEVREVVIEDLNGLVLAFGEPIGSEAASEPM